MNAAVLYLDAGYRPLRIENWQRAISDFFLGKVEVVEYSRDRTIRGVNVDHPLPSVVRLVRSFKRDRIRVKFSRINIYARDGFRCAYCGLRFATEDLTFDHVLPRSRGGRTDWKNIVTCCRSCNAEKGDKTPDEAGMRLRTKPSKPAHLPAVMVRMGAETPDEWKGYWTGDLEP